MTSESYIMANKLSMPTSNINPSTLAKIIDMNEDTITDTNKKDDNLHKNTPMVINLWDFTRMYQINHIPIVDFIYVYLILYTSNILWLHYDYKNILIGTIPIVILLNLLFNEHIRISGFLILGFFICIFYLVINFVKNNQQ